MENNVTPIRSRQAFHSPKNPAFLQNRIDRYYRERVMNTWDGGHIMRGLTPDQSSILLSSNDYLSIAQHTNIKNAIAESIEMNGSGTLMSGIFLHGDNKQLALEKSFANFMQSESSIISQSGWCANTGLIQSIANEHTPVYIDVLAHTSLWEGVKSAGASAVSIFHNDPEHLERQILRKGPGVVVIDSVYSTNGSIAPLVEIANICEKEGCILVVDESHSLGTHGPAGAGLVVELNLTSKVHFRTASLAKAFAGRAGIIACNHEFSDYFKFEANPAIFSSTLLPYEIAGLQATLDVIQKEDWRRSKLQQISKKVRENLDDFGYNLNGSLSQIISLESGTEQQTITLRNALEKRGVFGSVFCAPATAKNRALMRFSLNANLDDYSVEKIISVCREIRGEVGMHNWASTRRNRHVTREIPSVNVA